MLVVKNCVIGAGSKGVAGSGQETADIAWLRLSVEGSLSARAELELIQTQNSEAALLLHERSMNDHIQR